MKNISKEEKRLWLVLIFVGLFLLVFYKATAKEGKYIQVKVSGEIKAEYRLDEDREIGIVGKDNHINVLVIKDNKAYIKSAECPDKLCMHQGKIHTYGQSLVCLPNRIVVSVIKKGNQTLDNSEDESVDAISK